MRGSNLHLLNDLQMIWTIGRKDILDGLKNKTIWRYIVIVLLIMVSYRYLPLLGQVGEIEIVVYDQGASSLVEALNNTSQFEVRSVESMQEFEAFMDDGDEGPLGVVIPSGYDLALQSGEPVALEGHVLWSNRTKAETLRTDYEATFSELMGAPVQIQLVNIIIPQQDSMGITRMTALTPLLIVLIVGMMTVPTLMFEEKSTQTLATLLISPAKIGHVIAGKAVAGAAYCLSAGAIALAFNWVFVVNWGSAAVALLGTTLMAVGLGLVLGTFLDNLQQLSVWSMILFQPVLIPVVFFAIEPIFPQAVRSVLPWLPNVALVRLFHNSHTSLEGFNVQWGPLIVLVVSIALLYVLVYWKVRRIEQ
ncbi:MAG TPA: ABC transporter permease [Anaerolineae bacterium]|nr:ABC transporter permease [Anaerolineae bacterium]